MLLRGHLPKATGLLSTLFAVGMTIFPSRVSLSLKMLRLALLEVSKEEIKIALFDPTNDDLEFFSDVLLQFSC